MQNPAMAHWKSYHVLGAALAGVDAHPTQLFAWSVHAVVNGFVDHDAYLRTTARAAEERISAARLDTQMRLAIDFDANPIADLMKTSADDAAFVQRWNGFNQLAPLGVETLVSDDSAAALRRKAKAEEPHRPLRDQVAQACVATLLPLRRDRPGREEEAPRRLAAHLMALNVARSGLEDCVAYLYGEPAAQLADCARALGSSSRTLQREFTALGLRFGALRQAVRLTAAGHLIRTRDVSLTEVAQSAGFFDSAHLVHAWRQSCGISPSQYRALCGH